MTTTHAVWSALPYNARHALALGANITSIDGLDHDMWTLERIQVTAWGLLPLSVREAIHAETTCREME